MYEKLPPRDSALGCLMSEKMKLIKVEKVDEKFLKEVVRRIVSAVDPVKIIPFWLSRLWKAKEGE